MPTAEPPTARAPRGRLDALDGLRGLAATGVLVLHVWMFSYGDSHRPPKDFLDFTIGELRLGVQLFFVLSGFLIFRPFVAAALDGARRGPSLDPLRDPPRRAHPARILARARRLVPAAAPPRPPDADRPGSGPDLPALRAEPLRGDDQAPRSTDVDARDRDVVLRDAADRRPARAAARPPPWPPGRADADRRRRRPAQHGPGLYPPLAADAVDVAAAASRGVRRRHDRRRPPAPPDAAGGPGRRASPWPASC